MSVPLVAVKSTIFKARIQIPHFLFGVGETSAAVGGFAFIAPDEEDKRTKSRTYRTHTAQQQLKNVEQASTSSGNQCFLGHRSVPRIGLFAFDHSTIGGRAMHQVLAQLASAIFPSFEQEKHYAVEY